MSVPPALGQMPKQPAPRPASPVTPTPPLPPLPPLPGMSLLYPHGAYGMPMPSGAYGMPAGQQPSAPGYANPYVPSSPGYPSTSDSGDKGKRGLRERFRDLINEDGQLAWPLGLRVLPPVLETEPLRKQIESEVVAAVTRADEGKPAAPSVRLATRDIDRLRQQLRERAVDVPLTEHALAEAQRFLNNLKQRLKDL
jgi:hypothetical protein